MCSPRKQRSQPADRERSGQAEDSAISSLTVMTKYLLNAVLVTIAVVVPASATTYIGIMTQSQEVPPTGSSATGSTAINIIGNTMTVDLTWSGLSGAASMAHVHCCTTPGTNASVAVGYTGFAAATSGTYTGTFNLLDATIYTTAFLTGNGGGTATGARDALIAGLNA